MPSSETLEKSGVHAEINYVWNEATDPGQVLTFVTEDETESTMQTLPGRSVWIANARSLATDLDREGFVLVEHISSVEDFDLIQEDPDVDAVYIAEMTQLLAQVTGATQVIMLGGGKKRYGESASDKLESLPNGKPARYPHADNTDESSDEQIQMIGAAVPGLDLSRFSRIALYNMWRPVSLPPQDFPLAVCDARTVAAADEVTINAITVEKAAGEIRHDTTGYRHNPAHAWHYYPDMTRDEVIIFKAHDTDVARARRVPHSAFTDSTCVDGVPTRASVEMRALALFA
jgi:hypothetical protein